MKRKLGVRRKSDGPYCDATVGPRRRRLEESTGRRLNKKSGERRRSSIMAESRRAGGQSPVEVEGACRRRWQARDCD